MGLIEGAALRNVFISADEIGFIIYDDKPVGFFEAAVNHALEEDFFV